MVAPYCNDVYQLISGKESIRYKLDFGKYNLTTQDLTTLSGDAIEDYMVQGKRVIVAGLYKTDDFLAFVTIFKEKPYTFFQSIKTKKVYCLNDCIDSKLIPDGLIYGVTNDGTFYALIEPGQLVQFQQSSGLFKELTVKDVDNPYLILFKVTES